MKETIALIYNKIIGALPPLKEAHAGIYRLQVLVLLCSIKEREEPYHNGGKSLNPRYAALIRIPL
jgi:hypothetical protein